MGGGRPGCHVSPHRWRPAPEGGETAVLSSLPTLTPTWTGSLSSRQSSGGPATSPEMAVSRQKATCSRNSNPTRLNTSGRGTLA